MIQVTAPVEHHFLHAFGLSPFGDKLADSGCARNVATSLQPRGLFGGSGGDERMTLAIVDHLGVDIGYAAKDSQTRPLVRSLDLAADAGMNPPANVVFGNLFDHLAFAPAPVLPAFFRNTSPVYRTPLFL